MKKLMIMLAAVATAAVVQAASVSWSTVAMYDDTGAGTKVKDGAMVYVYLMDKTTYDGLSDIWGTYGADVKAGGTTAANVGGTKTGKYTNKANVDAPSSASANTTYYAAIIATFGTGDDMKYYAEKASVTTGDDGNGSYSAGIGVLDDKTTAAAAWTTAAVPEPTSGLLVLLGLAGLALRRRRA